MKPEIKSKWIEELRSGNYDQTTGYLFEIGRGYCCLGVLVEIYLREHGYKTKGMIDVEYLDLIAENSNDLNGAMPSDEIREWAGLSHEMCTQAADMNDVGEDFNSISNFLEEHA